MNIKVFSQQNIEKYAKQNHDIPTLLISITARDAKRANVYPNQINNIKNILFLVFDDTDNKITGIQTKDAQRIKTFLDNNISKWNIENILVNCNAGQSRSAGVAAALMYYFNENDKPIFDNPMYKPNMLCYRTVLNELFN